MTEQMTALAENYPAAAELLRRHGGETLLTYLGQLRHQPLPHVIGQTGVNCQQQQPGRQQQRDKRCEENAAEYALSHV